MTKCVLFVKLLLKTQLGIPINSLGLRFHYPPQSPQPHHPNNMTHAIRSSIVIILNRSNYLSIKVLKQSLFILKDYT